MPAAINFNAAAASLVNGTPFTLTSGFGTYLIGFSGLCLFTTTHGELADWMFGRGIEVGTEVGVAEGVADGSGVMEGVGVGEEVTSTEGDALGVGSTA